MSERVRRGDTAEDVLALLARVLPGQAFRSAVLHQDGWDNLAATVDGRWIFRFPVREEFRRDPERRFLAALEGRSPVAVPRVAFWSEDPPFMGYEKLPGIFAPDAWFQAPDPAWVRTLAADLAAFLHAVHAAIPAETARRWGAWPGPPEGEGRPARRAAALALPEGLGATALALAEAPLEPSEPLALYGDAHFGNLLFDPATRRLCGIIDFGAVSVGDPAYELYDLACRWPALAWAVAEAYEAQGGPCLSRANAKRYAAEFCLNVLAKPSLAAMRPMALKRLAILKEAEDATNRET